jgi:stress response protein SCP2
MESIAVQRLRVLPLPRGAGIPAKARLAVLAELAGMGYRLRNPELLDAADPSWLEGMRGRLDVLKAMRGGDVDYVPLFLRFPDDIPDDGEYFARRIVGYVGNFLRAFTEEDGERLDSGVVVPRWLFDLEAFGADPITQLQSPSLLERAKAKLRKRKADSHVAWIDLDLIWADDLEARLGAYLQANLYARSSIKEALHADLKALLLGLPEPRLDVDRIALSETKALVLGTYWSSGRLDAVKALARTPTDLLRMFASLTETDVSLATSIRFPKLRRGQRRAVLDVLERSPSLAEDLRRYRGLWLALGRYLHPGDHAKTHPKSAAAFAALCDRTITTFNSVAELLIGAGDLDDALAHLRARPGVFARRLHELLRRFPGEHAAILAAFDAVAESVPAKALLVLDRYFATINEAEHRAIINKKGKLKVLANNAFCALEPAIPAAARASVVAALRRRLAAQSPLPAGAKVWIDPRLERYVAPLQQRAASDGLLPFGRGSRIPVDLGRVLRLFVYWRQRARRTDLDLSVIQFDADLNYAGHVSYTNLSSGGICHSGDIQSAPHGAAEFIDITLSALPEGVRFLVAEVNRYCGEPFGEMRCHAGWMIRDEVNADRKTFDIKTVANKIDLTGAGAYALPLLVDLETREIVLTDLYMAGAALHNTVEGSQSDVALACRALREFTSTRPSMRALAEHHAAARGCVLLDDPAAAEVTFGVEGCTYNAADTATILAELL